MSSGIRVRNININISSAPSATTGSRIGGIGKRRALASLLSSCPFTLSSRRTISNTAPARATTALAAFKVPPAKNEPNNHYAPNSPDREALQAAITAFKKTIPIEIPLVIGGKAVRPSGSASTIRTDANFHHSHPNHPQHSHHPSTHPDPSSSSTDRGSHTHSEGQSSRHDQLKTAALQTQRNPADHAAVVARFPSASAADVQEAIASALKAKKEWENLAFVDRAAVFLKAAELVSTKYRYELMAVTMVGQGKNAWQAEIDAAAELCDFFRFNVEYAEQLYAQQPVHNTPGVWNRIENRPLEGFVYAVSPFNFTAIGANLAGAPVLMGNVVLWKPSPFAMAANYLTLSILTEAGLPPGVIQFVPGDAEEITAVALEHRDFAGLHYTGSTSVFRNLYAQIARGIAEGRYRSGYPRIVGEAGGKNFHLVHPSAEVSSTVYNTMRAAFEFQGQKCSACSRAYIPRSIWPEFRAILVRETEKLKIGDPEDFTNFMGPVIHEASFRKLTKVIDDSATDPALEILAGSEYDGSKGYFIRPTIYATRNVTHPLWGTELFGPILLVHVYDDSVPDYLSKICDVIDSTSSYGLTGSIFARDREAIRFVEDRLRHSAGNFYINAKCTGAVVGQQPFGGARASGTNDKAGSMSLLARFVSMRAIKEEFVGPTTYTYPSNR